LNPPLRGPCHPVPSTRRKRERGSMARWGHTPGQRVEDRFWAKVQKTDSCWLWTAAVTESGYGRYKVRSYTHVLAHRWVWENVYGSIPDGLFVCHHCDVPSCVRPSHLFVGTQAANMRDAAVKGRVRGWWSTPGAENPNKGKSLRTKGKPWSDARRAKGNVALRALTDEQELVVYRRWKAGERQAAIAADLGVSQSVVSVACRRVGAR